MTRPDDPVDFYEVLNLPFTGSSSVPSKQQIKVAYHKALLKYHPDKAGSALASETPAKASVSVVSTSDTPQTQIFTIDEITNAYKTLSDSVQRAEYDRALRLQRLRSGEKLKSGADVFHTGLEVVDLEDLNYEEQLTTESEGTGGGTYWYRGCRCGDEKGFVVTEDELDREAQHGEIVIGCRGCSLWMKILFAVAEEEEDDIEGGDSKT
jgi:diphthamide biosynthesis protein 4